MSPERDLVHNFLRRSLKLRRPWGGDLPLGTCGSINVVKRDGRWKILMEYQKSKGTRAEFEAL